MAWEAPIAVFSAVSGAGLGYLAYRRSVKVDATTAQSGVATENRAGVAQIIDGLNQLIDNLQEDNVSFRADLKECAIRITAISKERDDLRLELAWLRRRYGYDNGTPPSTPTTP
jgi:hypothetical protein